MKLSISNLLKEGEKEGRWKGRRKENWKDGREEEGKKGRRERRKEGRKEIGKERGRKGGRDGKMEGRVDRKTEDGGNKDLPFCVCASVLCHMDLLPKVAQEIMEKVSSVQGTLNF